MRALSLNNISLFTILGSDGRNDHAVLACRPALVFLTVTNQRMQPTISAEAFQASLASMHNEDTMNYGLESISHSEWGGNAFSSSVESARVTKAFEPAVPDSAELK